MRKYSKNGLDKRKEERKHFPEFFKKHVDIIKNNKLHCSECGCKLLGDVSEVAHILPKQTFKSISTEDSNVIYLCSWKSNSNCHAKFDNSSNEEIKKMSIFDEVSERYLELMLILTEKLNWKINERYTK